LSFEMSSLLVGESALPEEEAAVRAVLSATPGVLRVIHLRTLHTGPDEVLVGAKIAVEAQDSGAAIAATIDRAERSIRDAVPGARWIYLEPDLDRGQVAAQPDR